MRSLSAVGTKFQRACEFKELGMLLFHLQPALPGSHQSNLCSSTAFLPARSLIVLRKLHIKFLLSWTLIKTVLLGALAPKSHELTKERKNIIRSVVKKELDEFWWRETELDQPLWSKQVLFQSNKEFDAKERKNFWINWTILKVPAKPEERNCHLPTANCQLLSTVCQRPTAKSQQPTANSQQPTANCQLPTANCCLLSAKRLRTFN